MNNKFFKTDDGFLLPVNEKKYLIPFLTGTSKGTKYYEPAPINKIAKAYLADKLLQFHQFIDILSSDLSKTPSSFGIGDAKPKIVILFRGKPPLTT